MHLLLGRSHRAFANTIGGLAICQRSRRSTRRNSKPSFSTCVRCSRRTVSSTASIRCEARCCDLPNPLKSSAPVQRGKSAARGESASRRLTVFHVMNLANAMARIAAEKMIAQMAFIVGVGVNKTIFPSGSKRQRSLGIFPPSSRHLVSQCHWLWLPVNLHAPGNQLASRLNQCG